MILLSLKMIKLFCVLLVLVSCLAQNEEAQMFQMRRTACLILSRYFASSNRPMVDRTLETVRPENQQKFINKMYV